MDQRQYQNITSSMAQTIKSHQNLYKLTQVLLSLSLCSFIFSPSSFLVFLHYFKFYFSTIPFQLFTHNIDKNSMFLLCNGLLVFVGITRTFSASSAGANDHQHQLQPAKYVDLDVVDGSQSRFIDVDANEPMLVEGEGKEESVEIVEEKNIDEAEQVIENKNFGEGAEENVEKIVFLDEEQGEGIYQPILEEDEKVVDKKIQVFDEVDEEGDKGYSENDHFEIEEKLGEEEDDADEEEDYRLSTEEMNKKFDDFIRRMKEGLRIEAKSQLIMV